MSNLMSGLITIYSKRRYNDSLKAHRLKPGATRTKPATQREAAVASTAG
jgi:hypothetical protein